jgi:hypothetical protein
MERRGAGRAWAVWEALLDQCHQLSRLQLWQGVAANSCGTPLWQTVVARHGLLGPCGACYRCRVQGRRHPSPKGADQEAAGGLGWAEVDGRSEQVGIPAPLGQFRCWRWSVFGWFNHQTIIAKRSIGFDWLGLLLWITPEQPCWEWAHPIAVALASSPSQHRHPNTLARSHVRAFVHRVGVLAGR